MSRPAGVFAGWLFAAGVTLLVPDSIARSGRRDPGLDAAIVPGADVLARIDLDAIRRSGFLDRVLGGGAEAPALPGAAVGPIGRWTEIAGRLEGSGLATSDIREIFVSARSDVVEIGAPGKRDRSSPVPTLTAVSLASAISTEKLAAALAAVWDGRTTNLSEFEDSAVIELVSLQPGDRSIYAATSRQGTTIYLATDRGGLEGALARERSGVYEKLSGDLTRVGDSLSSGLDVSVILLAPNRLTAKLFDRPGRQDPSRPPTMTENMLEPFRRLGSLALEIDLGEEARIALLGDLAGEEEARNARTLLATMLLPTLSRALSTRFGSLVPLADSFTVDGEGSMARVNLRLSAADVRALFFNRSKGDEESTPKPPAGGLE